MVENNFLTTRLPTSLTNFLIDLSRAEHSIFKILQWRAALSSSWFETKRIKEIFYIQKNGTTERGQTLKLMSQDPKGNGTLFHKLPFSIILSEKNVVTKI